MDDGELTKELCEEVQETFDMQPEAILDCCACDEAKYEVTWKGGWGSRCGEEEGGGCCSHALFRY